MAMITKGKRAWKRDKRWRWGFIIGIEAREKLLEKWAFGIPGWLSSLTPAFGLGHGPGVQRSSPASGSLHGACFSLCLCL